MNLQRTRFQSLAIFTIGFLTFSSPTTPSHAASYRDVGDMFRSAPIGPLSDEDLRWIQNRGHALKNPTAVRVLALQILEVPDSTCNPGIEVLFFEDTDCEGKFCRLVIKCGSPATSPASLNRPSLTLMARKDIAVADWTFRVHAFDSCQRLAIRVSTPSGPILVIVGQFGFELADPNSDLPSCGHGISF